MPTGNTATANSESLGNGATDSYELGQAGADKLSGAVTRDNTAYDVDVVWQDQNRDDIETESIASNVSGGNQTTFDVAARSPYAKLEISDSGSGSGSYDLVAHFR